MKEKYKKKLTDLSKELVTPERYSEVQPIGELATVLTLFPDLPQAAIYYFPEQLGDGAV